jgi:hypothetical protein
MTGWLTGIWIDGCTGGIVWLVTGVVDCVVWTLECDVAWLVINVDGDESVDWYETPIIFVLLNLLRAHFFCCCTAQLIKSTLLFLYYLINWECTLLKFLQFLILHYKILFKTFPHSWFTNRFYIRVTRCVPLEELDLLTLPEHLSSSPFFCGVHVAQSLVYCVVFYRSMVVFPLIAHTLAYIIYNL